MSIPHVSFIEFDVGAFQQRAQFILERFFPVMLRPSANVAFHPFEIRLTNGKGSVTGLPAELLMPGKSLVNPFRRVRLDGANQVGDRRLFAQRNQEMDVVGYASFADEENPPRWNRRATLELLRKEAEALLGTDDPESAESDHKAQEEE